jgi:RNA polymerase sigma-70 factor (ECF subfamily)
MQLVDDNLLLQQLKEGSEAAFSIIYSKYWRTIFMLAYDRLKDTKQSQDIVQDIFISLWERRENLEIQNLSAYLHSSVRYGVYKLVAANKVKDDFFDLSEVLSSPSSFADHRIISKELMSAYQQMIEKMPPQRQKIFKMRHEENLKTRVIAEQLNLSQKTVQNQLLSSYKNIRSLLAQLLSISIFLLTYLNNK